MIKASLVICYMVTRSRIINYINTIKDAIRTVTDVKGINSIGDPVKSLYLRYLLIKVLIFFKNFVSNAIRYIDSQYYLVEISKIENSTTNRRIYKMTSIEDIMSGDSTYEEVKSTPKRVYIRYSLDDNLCLKHILQQYDGGENIKEILTLNGIKYNENSKIYVRYMDKGKIRDDIIVI